jgi:hypothetical protein
VGGTQGGSQSGSQAGGGSSGSAGGGSQAGDGDSLEGLDDALDGSLEDFDDAIAGTGGGSGPDTIDILSRSGGGSSATGPLFEEGDIGTADGPIENSDVAERAGEGAPPGTESGQPTQTASNSTVGEGGTPGEVIPVPADIDDGRGDNIVLRQIRDAAMKEPDPVLREKLWDEYRRIKNQG